MKQIKISDNGEGIHSEDFELLCERFATSKIASAEDLSSLTSFGFRGEALASVSYVAELEVKSRRKGTDFGYRSKFLNSKMLQTPEIEPMNPGTIFVVENLFYNL